jgi:putative ABC transport system permease protein
MKTRALLALVRTSIRRARRSFVLSVFGIAVGIASLTFFLALSSGVRSAVLERAFPPGQLEVVPKSSSAGGALGLLSLGGPLELTDDAIARLQLEPGVGAAFPRTRLAFPARAFGGGELVGRDVHAELVAEGVDPRAVAADSVGPEPFSDELGSLRVCSSDADCAAPEYCPDDTRRCERPVPAVISQFMLEIYNGSIAPSHGLPKIGKFLASRFRGFVFHVVLGQSVIPLGAAPTAPPRERRLMLVGIAPRAAQLAVTLPLGRVREWNRQFAGERAAHTFSSVLLDLDEHAQVARVAQAVRDAGYAVADAGAERAGLALLLVTLLLALVSVAVLTVAAINIAHSFYRQVAERRREIGVLRSVGASAVDVERLLLAEAVAIGACGGVAGVLLARLGALVVDAASRRYVPDFPFQPDSYFSFDLSLVAIALGCAVAACALGAWFPARAAARVDPAEALSGP